jgi:hypothetical protein
MSRARGAALGALLIVAGGLAIASACASNDAENAGTSPAPPDAQRPGSLVAADTLSNTTIGGPHGTALAFRFRAQWTGRVRGVRVHVILNPRGRSGYSGGTGGLLRVSLDRNSRGGRHVPRGRPLAATVIRPSRRDLWPFVRFAEPPRVVAGRLYPVVFTNVADDPQRNYPSINALRSRGHGEPMPRVPDGLAVLLGDTADGGATPTRWRSRAIRPGDRYVPIVDVVGDRPADHVGIGYMEAWVTAPKPIGERARVRQLLSVPGRGTAKITGAWLRVVRARRTASALDLRLEHPDGGRLASASVAAHRVSRRAPKWVHVRFSSPVSVPAGTPLSLTASARQPRSYKTFPMRKGTGFGFDARTVFSGGYAQFSDGGDWRGWEQWGQRDRRDSDLQFALDIHSAADGADSR